MKGVTTGNAVDSSREHKSWFLGRFITKPSLRNTRDVEIKWATHKGPFQQEKFTANLLATTISIVLSGTVTLEFREGDENLTVTLEKKGNYALWLPHVYHRLRVEDNCEILTVRWPSCENDQIDL